MNLRALRESADLSASEAARRAGMTRQAWYRLEQGGRPDPRLSTLRRVRKALGCSWAELLGE